LPEPPEREGATERTKRMRGRGAECPWGWDMYRGVVTFEAALSLP
jgi:hypothetical protein